MRHRVYGKHLGRDKDERRSLFRGLVRELFIHESIVTTQAKAKAIKGLVDRLISKSRKDDLTSKHLAGEFLSSKEITKKLLEEIAPRYKERTSGFTNLVKLGQRAGDGAMLVKMSLVQEDKKKLLAVSRSPRFGEAGQSSDTSQSVVGESVTEEQKTDKPKPKNRKPKTGNKKAKGKK
ncbi:MAG: 50S ribosomal protein L17 [bacterium]|nr:50S ribosomal protein L17 [bacterium]